MKNINKFIESIGTINRYSLLGRLVSDCEYFLGYGNRCEKHLWAGNVQYQIFCMKVLYLTFKPNLKPNWLNMNDIINFQNQMQMQFKN